jgi:hypothetical protein
LKINKIIAAKTRSNLKIEPGFLGFSTENPQQEKYDVKTPRGYETKRWKFCSGGIQTRLRTIKNLSAALL